MHRKQSERPWHIVDPAALLEQLGTTAQGLTEAEADARLQPYGPNKLGAEPVSAENWLAVVLLAATIIPALELHKLTWYLRGHRRT